MIKFYDKKLIIKIFTSIQKSFLDFYTETIYKIYTEIQRLQTNNANFTLLIEY